MSLLYLASSLPFDAELLEAWLREFFRNDFNADETRREEGEVLTDPFRQYADEANP